MIRWLLLLALVAVLLRALRVLLARARQPRPAGPAERWDPHAVLGVTRGSSRQAIKRAYREQLKGYHPDRVADLGPDLQRLAHQKTIELQRAYDELTRRPR